MIVSGIHIPDGDTHFAGQIAKNPPYRGKGTHRWAKLEKALAMCTRREHAVDVGAHVGLWTRVLSYEFRKVTAFEPVQAHLDCLRLNLRARRNVDVYPEALGERPGPVRMTLAADGAGTASLADDGEIEASMLALDIVLIDPIDFLKLSCEGAEYHVLIGGQVTIQRDKPVIVIEQKRKRLGRQGLPPEAGVDLLKSWGAQVAWVDHGDWCMTWA